MAFSSTDAEHNRLRSMGIAVGQITNLPTRALRNETRQFLWDELTNWPRCTESEGENVNHTEVRFKCSTPTPMNVIDTADVVTQLFDMRSPIELL